jgi:hypothetical protein
MRNCAVPFSVCGVPSLDIGGDVGCHSQGFDVATSDAGPWTAVLPLTAGGFNRPYWDVPSARFQSAALPFQNISGRNVCESRGHFGATHHLRLVGHSASGGALSPTGTVLKVCGTEANHGLAVAQDNRLPATLAREPRADVLAVRIGSLEASPAPTCT